MTTTIQSYSCKHAQIQVNGNLLEINRYYQLITPLFEAIVNLKKVDQFGAQHRLTVEIENFIKGNYFKNVFEVITTDDESARKWLLTNATN